MSDKDEVSELRILGKYAGFWRAHFGGHVIIGLVAIGAGLVVITRVDGGLISGLALGGAGLFALVNGLRGLKRLRTAVRRPYQSALRLVERAGAGRSKTGRKP